MSKHFAWRKRRVTSLLLGALAAVAIAGAGVAHAESELKPTPPVFPSQYGDMTFPEQYPDGTAITITQWSHFVPRYDDWYDQYAQKWGEAHNVDVTVNHISYADLATTLASSITAGKGPTLIEMIGAPSAFIEGLKSLNDVNTAAAAAFGERAATCEHSTYLPTKDMWYGFCHGWVPDPGVYRTDLWQDAGYPHGPESYADLLKGGAQIFEKTGVPVGAGMSPDIDSEFFTRAVIWSFGGTIQDKNGNVVFDSPETVAAVKYLEKLYIKAMTPEVLAWNAASNNQAYIAGTASYIQNSISFFRSAQDIGSEVTEKTGFRPGLKGPGGEVHMPSHLWFIYVMPDYVTDQNEAMAAKNYLLDLENNYSSASYYSKLYDFPAFTSQVPQLFAEDGWLQNDPWGSQPADKLAVLATAPGWTAWPGYPGYANPAIGEIYQTRILTTLVANVVRGQKTAEQAVGDAAENMRAIFEKWRERGFVPSGDSSGK